LTKDQLATLTTLEQEGELRIEYQLNRAYISPSLWLDMDAKAKEGISAALAVHCGTKKGTNANWVEIYDKQSGKKLAKYGVWGFEVY